MRLQTKYPHKKLTTINVNGRVYQIDASCCIDVDSDADAKKLLSLGDEWSAEVKKSALLSVSKIPEPGKPMRTAVEFVALLAQDEALSSKVSALRSFTSLASLAGNLGFRFTEAEFKAATDQYQRDAVLAARLEKERATPAEAPKAPEPAPQGTDHRKSDKLPKRLEEEVSGEWPDPSEEFSVAYLKRMAAAYGVSYPPNTAKAEVVAMITKAMYE